MSTSKMSDYKVPSKIVGIQFSMLSPEEIRKNSVLEITSKFTFDSNKPVPGGLFDTRMGVLEPGMICPTDGYTYTDTPGYFGHIELARPVFFTQHIKEIMKICKCVCYKCNKLLISKRQHAHALEMSASERWEYVYKLASEVNRCGLKTEDGCSCKQPSKIKLEEIASIYAVWENVKGDDGVITTFTEKLTPEIIIQKFKRISDDDVHFMGFSPIWSRPEWMVCQVLPVPPPAVRPSVKMDAQQRSEDDLTHIYSNIIKFNKDLQEKINKNASAYAVEGTHKMLQYFVAMIVNNKTKGAAPLAQRSGRPFQCITGRINHKNGRIRGNLMGKRVDFSARSVITGDPNLSIRQLGVPMKIAKNITKPITVNSRNYDFLLKLVQNGPDVYPGANKLERKNGVNIHLKIVDRNSIVLEEGDVVHRHLMDGDAVLFNRQPSLHRMSMMCHIVKVMRVGDSFRMNVGDTKPYNADFDGDEMNMHAPQNVLAETELRHLAAIPYQIVSPASNAPLIGIYQDSLLGSYRFTRSNINLTARQAMNLLMMYSKVDTQAIREGHEKKTLNSFDVLTQILSPLTLNYKTKLYDDDTDNYKTTNNVLEIRNGKYIRGQIEKSVLASTTKGILHRIFNDYGNMACSNFIDDLQNVVTEYMKTSSFSVGISDLLSDKKTQDKINSVILAKKLEVQAIIDKVHLGIFENKTVNSNMAEFENIVNAQLNKAMDESGKEARKSLSPENRFLMIVNSGSKGSLLNISQMIAGLGQKNVESKRIPYGFDSRTLPHYCKYDDSPNARGFIDNSYISGLTAPELFFDAMGGRIGLIDTAVKTSQTGYIQRRLIKGMEDLKVEYDMTVRNSKGKIVQFSYGDDGIDPTKVENQSIPLVGMSIEDIYIHYDMLAIDEENNKDILEIYTESTKKRMKQQKEITKEICYDYILRMLEYRDKLVQSVFKYKDENSLKLPVSFQNTIANIQGQLNLSANSIVDITPKEAFNLIEEYYDKLNSMNYIKPNSLFEVYYFYYLTPKDLLVNKRFNLKALTLLLEMILLKYKQSIIQPGEMVGIIAGQSTGEPTTQLTLNTFHNSGISSKSNVTRGVPRIEELLRLTSSPKGPSLTIHLKTLEETDESKASKYANMIEYTKLINVIKSVQICFEPHARSTSIQDDKVFLQQFYEFEDMISDCDKTIGNDIDSKNFSKWIIRLEMDAEILLEKNISMDDIHYAIRHSHLGSKVSCVFSDFNHDKLIFRIRMLEDKKKNVKSLDESDNIYVLKQFQDILLNTIVLRGINNIEKVMTRKLKNMVVLDDGKYVKRDCWVLDTTGTNLLSVLGLDYIDSTRTFSNDVREVFDVLGLEAARQILCNEFTEVMETSDAYINYHHLGLLCDRMTTNKDMVPIFRSGLLKDNIGPIAKATFEVHTEVLLDAARHADFDHMRGVSSAVMCGQYGNYGTGSFSIVLDTKEMVKLAEANIQEGYDIEKMLDISIDNGECSKSKIEIKNNIVNINTKQVDLCDDDYDIGI